MDSIVLLGSEQVQRAAIQMQRAAETISQAALNITGAFLQHQRFLDDWLQRAEAIIDAPQPQSREGAK